jgi:hypothetical protein
MVNLERIGVELFLVCFQLDYASADCFLLEQLELEFFVVIILDILRH